ncbi:Carboxylic ester hydrolase [Mycena sanguinolenta]|uniref:Carboxylic ester hydrolase n=1 Tax=Mycena sanguinolenta TaxID=230812 RepID=A0A8H6XYW6_9AGAR|nr:Carboxylic ester hydrolase [Mycena sanguinolenta]
MPYSVTFSVEDHVGHFTEVGYVFNTQSNDTAFWLTNHFTATYLGPTTPIADRSWASICLALVPVSSRQETQKTRMFIQKLTGLSIPKVKKIWFGKPKARRSRKMY